MGLNVSLDNAFVLYQAETNTSANLWPHILLGITVKRTPVLAYRGRKYRFPCADRNLDELVTSESALQMVMKSDASQSLFEGTTSLNSSPLEMIMAQIPYAGCFLFNTQIRGKLLSGSSADFALSQVEKHYGNNSLVSAFRCLLVIPDRDRSIADALGVPYQKEN